MDESGFSPARRNRCGNQTMNQEPLLMKLLNRLPPLFRKLSSVAQKLSQLRNDPNPDNQSSI
ncbi:hypothetical protein [Rhizobium ruizarguesonis]|uniref:hypothetical protein n=1 Tax=Rhizobium ruizarguesonis TaxID=2081791 RepID=UPI00102F34F7|nr:hypothetical protein [Rhizobium ruizarguesonis]MBY5896344.1 hypothetical protein [Rhizobium leguminosarum]TBD27136.1 hypothetical protein ELH20_05895 [Rhizobium ruizarguesonis]TBE05572.1 hypothetical protein ELH12_05855 [Rhizobium ruizarguesonis]TBE76793.1 hypothetical protein ELH01_05835 [Rhizobium ruizarguesonis]TBE86410.1 hypothetical protein ELG99_05855 [Rhizobium ruizarguesonis]